MKRLAVGFAVCVFMLSGEVSVAQQLSGLDNLQLQQAIKKEISDSVNSQIQKQLQLQKSQHPSSPNSLTPSSSLSLDPDIADLDRQLSEIMSLEPTGTSSSPLDQNIDRSLFQAKDYQGTEIPLFREQLDSRYPQSNLYPLNQSNSPPLNPTQNNQSSPSYLQQVDQIYQNFPPPPAQQPSISISSQNKAIKVIPITAQQMTAMQNGQLSIPQLLAQQQMLPLSATRQPLSRPPMLAQSPSIASAYPQQVKAYPVKPIQLKPIQLRANPLTPQNLHHQYLLQNNMLSPLQRPYRVYQ